MNAEPHAPTAPIHVEHAAPYEPLDTQTLRAALGRIGLQRWAADVVATTPSTNATLLRDLRHGSVTTPCVLTTDFQSDGRGRRGRSWRSAPGASLTVSFGISSDRDLVALEGITLACGLAVRDALVPLGIEARLKWPNDVVVDGGKLAGILVESLRTTRTILVIGIGINVRPVPGDDAATYRATDLASCGLASCDRHGLIASLASALAIRIEAVERAGFASMANEYNAVDAYLGRRVTLSRGDGSTTTGIERGVDARGALCIDSDAGRLSVVAGDISLRLADA
jgi:BirA family biotin operon repressor/biotin-[acetyl-CoA-carboxylase] ligase